jgi:hypothetical protein
MLSPTKTSNWCHRSPASPRNCTKTLLRPIVRVLCTFGPHRRGTVFPNDTDRSRVDCCPANADEFKEKLSNPTNVSQPPPSEPLQINLLQLEISRGGEAQDELAFPPDEMSRAIAEF